MRNNDIGELVLIKIYLCANDGLHCIVEPTLASNEVGLNMQSIHEYRFNTINDSETQ